MKNIAIVGAGGVGGYFGGKLCQLLGEDSILNMTMIARGAHLAAIQEKGLILNTEKEGRLLCHPTISTDSLESLESVDLFLLSVKEFDLADVLERMKGSIRDDSVILPLLNGVDVYSRIRQSISNGIVLPACVYVGTHIEAPGVVTQKGGACKIVYGPDPRHSEYVPEDMIELFKQANILSDWTPSVQSAIWEKFVFICSFGLVTTAYDKVIGEVMEDESLRVAVKGIMKEVLSVASALEVVLPEGIESIAFEKGRTFPYETKTSFQRDFERVNKKDERELFAGAMLQYGKQKGLELPMISELAARLHERKPVI
jgi:2-dehydropantoate 2-reductase